MSARLKVQCDPLLNQHNGQEATENLRFSVGGGTQGPSRGDRQLACKWHWLPSSILNVHPISWPYLAQDCPQESDYPSYCSLVIPLQWRGLITCTPVSSVRLHGSFVAKGINQKLPLLNSLWDGKTYCPLVSPVRPIKYLASVQVDIRERALEHYYVTTRVIICHGT